MATQVHDAEQATSMQRLLSIDAISGMENRVRPISAKHLLELAASIASHGLVSPISVDRNNVLLAGAHRLAAFTVLQHADTEDRKRAFLKLLGRDDVDLEHPPTDVKAQLQAIADLEQSSFAEHHPGEVIPARVFAFDSKHSEKRALAIEVAENEKRRNFSQKEVDEIIERLESAGFTTKHGRLKAGEKPLVPELATILKVSRRTVFRLLDAFAKDSGKRKPKSNRGRKPTPSWQKPLKFLDQLGKAAEAVDENATSPQWRAFIKSSKQAVKELGKLASDAIAADQLAANEAAWEARNGDIRKAPKEKKNSKSRKSPSKKA